MVTLANLDGRSLALDLNAAFGPAIQQIGADIKADNRENKDIDLLLTAQGLPGISPGGDKKSEGFLRKIAPGLADQLDKLNKNRDPDQIDQLRREAAMNVETAARIRNAKTQAEKQRIILERAGEFQKQGRDNRELLKMSGMTPAEIDLQAQKAEMTGKATLKALPAPTDRERLAARAQLAVRNPQAFNALMREEAVARQIEAQKAAQARAGAGRAASAAEAAQRAQIMAQMRGAVTGQPATVGGGQTAPQSQPQTVGGVPLEFGKLDVGGAAGFDPIIESARAQQAEISDPATALLAGEVVTGLEGQRQAAQDVGLQAARQSVGVSDVDPGLSFGDLAQPEAVPETATPEQVDLIARADAIYRQAQAATDRAIAQRDSIADPTLRKMADTVVKEFEDAEKAALADREAEIEFAKDTKPEAPEMTDLGQIMSEIAQNVQTGLLTPEQGAQAQQMAVAESLKAPDYKILSESEARVKLGDGYDDTKTYQVSPNGQITPVGGGGVVVNTGSNDEAIKLSEQQSKLVLFGKLAETSQPVFDTLEGGGFDPGNTATYIAEQFGDLGNFWKSPQARQYNAAKSAWAEGVLRIQTGAAATQPEIERVRSTYFAQVGDDPSTIAFKRQLRVAYAEAIGLASGGLINPNDISNSVITKKVAEGNETLRPNTFAAVQSARPDMSPQDISKWWEGLTPEQQAKINKDAARGVESGR